VLYGFSLLLLIRFYDVKQITNNQQQGRRFGSSTTLTGHPSAALRTGFAHRPRSPPSAGEQRSRGAEEQRSRGKQLIIINYQLSIINYQLSIINYQLSIINYQLSIINYQLSIINYQLSINKKGGQNLPTLLIQAIA
jgi:hypothetical protein